MVFALLANPGQSFMMSDPGYPCNRQFLRLVEARGQLVPVTADSNFQLTPEQVSEHWHADTAGVLLASPANPTGAVLNREQLAALADAVHEQGGHLVVDELYHGLTYGFEAPTVLQVDPDAFVINSFSKYFGMTGWRLGWIVAPESAVPELEKLAQNLYISPSTVSQYAALAAFAPQTLEILEQRRQAFGKRRDLLLAGLRELGLGIPVEPQGAFYVYADVSHLTDNAFDFCWDLLETEYLAVTPGLDFGQYRADAFIRFSYTTSLERIELGLERLRRRLARG
jgi:aspartate/methionine/tyrosine aminotransferase